VKIYQFIKILESAPPNYAVYIRQDGADLPVKFAGYGKNVVGGKAGVVISAKPAFQVTVK
jgi:hypothetical protein